MTTVRFIVALVFAGLYAALMLRAALGEEGPAGLTAAAPLCTLAVTYLLGTETIRALRRRNGNGGANGAG